MTFLKYHSYLYSFVSAEALLTRFGCGVNQLSSGVYSLSNLWGDLVFPSLVFAFGHHHLDLTRGPKTGRLVADIILGKHLNVDMMPYSVSRF